MKAQILKIAGVKSEKEFYKKYPSEEAFMKVHGKAFKKAQMGTYIGGTSVATPKMVDYGAEYDTINKMITGSTDAEKRAAAEKAAAAKKDSGGGGGMDMSSIMGMFGGGARYGADIPNAQWGTMTPGGSNNWQNSWEEDFNNTQNNPYGTYAPGNYSENDIDNNGVPDLVQNPEGNPLSSGQGPTQDAGGGGGGFDAMKGVPIIGGIIGGMQALEKQKEAKRAAKQAKKVSDVGLIASGTRPEETKRRYNTPWDNPIQAGQMFPTYGVGTNVLARSGARLQGGGEIQNTYAPNYLYDDLEYEPLNDSNVKQYYDGGDIPRANFGLASKGGAGFGENPYGGMVGGMFDNNAGSQIGGSIGSAFGPVGGAAGSMIGGMLDTDQRDIDKYNRQTKRNMQGMAMNNMIPGIHSGHRGHMKDGGYMNPEYNPQVITMFGDHTAEDFADYAHKYRAGGHLKEYTPPSEEAMHPYEDGGEITSYAMGGQLKTHWGGEAETMSHNPYSAGSGEMVKFNGQSHTESDKKGNTGIGITYGDSPVEVERGEPMFEMQSGGEVNPETGEPENTGVVFGNMQVDKRVASQFNDPELMGIVNKYNGKKFKNIGIDLAKQEAKQNKTIAKATDELEALEVRTPFDKLKLSALRANLEGADAKLKNIANTKIILANYQNAINDSKDEISEAMGSNISAEDLAKGRVKPDKDPVTMNAKWGSNIVKKAQAGTTVKSYPNDAAAKKDNFTWTGKYGPDGKTKLYERVIKKFKTDESETKAADALGYVPAGQKQSASGTFGKVTPETFAAAKAANSWYPGWDKFDPKNKTDVKNYQRAFNARAKAMGSSAQITDDGDFGEQTVSARIDESKKSTPTESEETLRATVAGPSEQPEEEEKSKTPWWAMAANTLLPYFRPTDQEAFDYAQLYPEMNALATNQLEPVPVQGYRPDIGTPYDISFQDQLNANQADYNASQRMVGYNPAAQANLNAQKYAANTGVLGSQFRANQEMKDKVYGENRNILNQAKLTNLDIFDRQYGRQAEAKSNTKATTQAALSSMADKYAKHKLENKTLGIYENMYNYRFDKNGRAQNYNPLQIFDTQASGSKGKGSDSMPGYKATSYDKDGNVLTWKKNTSKDDSDDSDLEAVGGIKNKNGGAFKKNQKNSSVVRAYKNI